MQRDEVSRATAARTARPAWIPRAPFVSPPVFGSSGRSGNGPYHCTEPTVVRRARRTASPVGRQNDAGRSRSGYAVRVPPGALRALIVAIACLAACEAIAQPAAPGAAGSSLTVVDGGIRRGPVDRKRMALVFTGHEFAEGAEVILDALAARRAPASFFLTGAFLRNAALQPFVRRMVAEGHYVGPHSDAHLLYAPWEGPKRTLVSRDAFRDDLRRNIDAVTAFGVPRAAVSIFLPSYEWYTADIAAWTREMGMTLVCHTQGTRSTVDYTEEGTPQFVSSEAIFESILRREREDPHGLNGFLLLLHVGAGPGRADTFHRRFAALLDELSSRGYTFVRLDELLGAAADQK